MAVMEQHPCVGCTMNFCHHDSGGEGRGFVDGTPKIFLITTPFTLAINVVPALLSATEVPEKI